MAGLLQLSGTYLWLLAGVSHIRLSKLTSSTTPLMTMNRIRREYSISLTLNGDLLYMATIHCNYEYLASS